MKSLSQINNPLNVFAMKFSKNIVYRGEIFFTDREELLYSKKDKLHRSIYLGEPYQLGGQIITNSIRLASDTHTGSIELRDFILYGDFLGAYAAGDEVEITARKCGGRNIVLSIYNFTTNTQIRPSFQAPAWLARVYILFLPFVIMVLVCGVLWTFMGGMLAFITALLGVMLLAVMFFVEKWKVW